MTMRRASLLLAAATAMAAIAVLAGPASAGSGGQLRIEPAWYDGKPIQFLQPSLFSANPNGGVLGCFGLGPNLSAINRPTAPLYVIFDPTAIQDHCDAWSAGCPVSAAEEFTLAFCHEHVLSVAPGDPGYTGAWRLVLLVEATPGSVDVGTTPFTSEAQVLSAIRDGTLVDVTSVFSPAGPPTMVAPVIGGN
jgi:hypothetical protein